MIVNEEVIYPSMVIRSQAEAIELLEKENKKYKEVIDKIKKEVDKIFVEGQIINKCLLLSIYENIWRIINEVST